jgi:hypothetical protein
MDEDVENEIKDFLFFVFSRQINYHAALHAVLLAVCYKFQGRDIIGGCPSCNTTCASRLSLFRRDYLCLQGPYALMQGTPSVCPSILILSLPRPVA